MRTSLFYFPKTYLLLLNLIIIIFRDNEIQLGTLTLEQTPYNIPHDEADDGNAFSALSANICL